MLSLLLALTACAPDTKDDTGSTAENTDTGVDTDDTDDTNDSGETDDTDTADTGGDTAECEPTDETCNGVDDDCDGAVDESGSLGEVGFYADADNDGFGDATVQQLACSAPAGYVDNPRDCDDTNASVNPAGTEVAADGADNDCDPGTIVATHLYDTFSSTSNPFGDWSLGYAADASGAGFVVFNTYAAFDATVDYWSTSGVEGVRVYRNSTASDWSYSSTRLSAMSIMLHPGAAGEYAVVRWTAPAATECEIAVSFTGNDSTSTAVAVVVGGTDYGSDTIDGLGDSFTLSSAFAVGVGDTVDFSVGHNGSYVFDSTGLDGSLYCI